MIEYKKLVPCYNTITENELILNIDKGIFDHELEGTKVILSEDTKDHEWVIVRVNSDSYDLWYHYDSYHTGNIGEVQWSENLDMSWNNSNVRQLCNQYKSKLSSFVQNKLKPGLNKNCGDDLVVILSVKQLGCTSHNIINDDNIIIPYFNDNDKRSINMNYWTTSFSLNKASVNLMNNIWCIDSIGIPYEYYYAYNYNSYAVVPAIRLG